MRVGLIIAALVLSAPGLSMAQATRTTLVTIPTTQRQGVVQSASVDVPANATGVFLITADIASADYSNPDNSLWMRVYLLDPATGLWRVDMATKWEGGDLISEGVVNPRPYMAIDIADYRGRSIRAELDNPLRMRIGATVELLTP